MSIGNLLEDFYYVLIIFFAFISSLQAFRLDMKQEYKMFSIFLLATFLVELFAVFWSFFWYKGSNNYWIYNSYLPVQYLFYFYFFYHLFDGRKMKMIIFISGMGCIFFTIANLLFLQKAFAANTYTVILADLLIIFFSVSYFYKLLGKRKVINLARHPPFWVATGALIFHLGTLPFFIMINYIVNSDSPVFFKLLFLLRLMNGVMYTCYACSFLCIPQKKKY